MFSTEGRQDIRQYARPRALPTTSAISGPFACGQGEQRACFHGEGAASCEGVLEAEAGEQAEVFVGGTEHEAVFEGQGGEVGVGDEFVGQAGER